MYERAYKKYYFKDLDVSFLLNCKKLGVFPRFITGLKLYYVSNNRDKFNIWRKMLNSAIDKAMKTRKRFLLNLTSSRKNLADKVSNFIFSLCIRHCIRHFSHSSLSKRISLSNKLDELKTNFC